jgi:pyruvate dehydrogenase E2 component (dihydrolipoamide acetyltransferase)
MATEVILPKVDMDMTTGRVSRWLVAEGATVKQGDTLFEIETDKAAMEIESPASGVLRNVSAHEGVDIPVGTAVAWIFADGETAVAPPSAMTEMKQPSSDTAAAPAVKPQPPEIAAVHATSAANGVRATPLARRLAREGGIELPTLKGTGPRGRITRADIEVAIAARRNVPEAPLPAIEKPAADDSAIRKFFAEGSFSEVPHDSMRKTIARRLTESKSTVPHFYLTADCRLDALLKLRGELNAAAPKLTNGPAYKLSINDMVIKAWALALRDLPMANVSWTENAMLQHAHADVGVAVSIPGGLITPIIRSAETKSLSAISNEMKDLATRAKERKLKAEEYQGGSSAISNLGMFGVREFAAIINPPHATILAVGGGDARPVVENGVVVPATVMTVTLSTDHRAVDGALGAEVLKAFKTYIEEPLALLA